MQKGSADKVEDWAWDMGSFKSKTPPPQESYYYSQKTQEYVEIKEGTPENETYEAMAGVPVLGDFFVCDNPG